MSVCFGGLFNLLLNALPSVQIVHLLTHVLEDIGWMHQSSWTNSSILRTNVLFVLKFSHVLFRPASSTTTRANRNCILSVCFDSVVAQLMTNKTHQKKKKKPATCRSPKISNNFFSWGRIHINSNHSSHSICSIFFCGIHIRFLLLTHFFILIPFARNNNSNHYQDSKEQWNFGLMLPFVFV